MPREDTGGEQNSNFKYLPVPTNNIKRTSNRVSCNALTVSIRVMFDNICIIIYNKQVYMWYLDIYLIKWANLFMNYSLKIYFLQLVINYLFHIIYNFRFVTNY